MSITRHDLTQKNLSSTQPPLSRLMAAKRGNLNNEGAPYQTLNLYNSNPEKFNIISFPD